jgi:hypothetical protein
VEVKLNDMVWNGDGSYGNAMLGSCRWVLVPAEKSICAGCTTPATLCPSANDSKDRVIDCVCKNTRMPVAKEPAHTSPVGCEGCLHEKLSFLHSTCWNCQHEGDDIVPRKNYTPAPAPAPKVTDEVAHTSCKTCRYKADNGSFNITSAMCGNCFNYERLNRSNYVPELAVTRKEG